MTHGIGAAPSWLRSRPAQVLLLALVYFAVARVSLGLSFGSTNASPVWPPSGIALAALLLGGYRLGVGVLAGAFAANLVTFMANGAAPWGPATLASLLIAGGNMGEALVAAWACRRFNRGSLTDSPQGAYVFAVAALGAAMVSASCGVATLVGLGIVPGALGSTVWLTWWLGDATGLLVLTPPLLLLRHWRPRRPAWREVLLALVLFAGAGFLTFGELVTAGHLDRLMAYGLVAFIAWAALRHGSLAAAMATLGIAALSIMATIHGHGPFAKATVNDSLVSLDGFMALCAITGMVLAASVQRRAAAPAGIQLPSAILLAGLAATTLAWHFIAADTERRAAERFDGIAEDIRARVQERMSVYEQALRGGRGLFDASINVERDEWRRYVQSLTINQNYPGIQGLGFSLRVPAAQLQRHVDGMRAAGLPGYALRPPGERDEYTGIIYLEPQDQRNQRAIGYDMYSEPVRRAAMERARDSGQPSISGKVTLVQEIDKDVQAGFLMYVPVYRRGMPTETLQQRRAALLGYVYGPFRMGDLMQSTLQRVDVASVSLSIYDGGKASDPALMYSNAPDRRSGYPHQFVRTLPVEIAGHRWLAEFKSTQVFEDAIDTQKAQIALVAGTLISLLLFTVVRSLAVRREDALALAQRTSEARAEAEQRFESLAESAGDSILVLDGAGRVLFCNRAGSRMFGRPVAELQGRELHTLLKLPQAFEDWKQAGRIGASASSVLETVRHGDDDAPVPVEVSLGTWDGPGGPYFSITARDISARRRAEESLREAMHKERQASQAKGQFLANMSHEIRTPMNAVIGLSYLLGQTRLDAEQAGFLAKIKLASASLLSIIDDVLDLSKIEAGELTLECVPFDLQALLADLAAVMTMQARAKAIGFALDMPADLPRGVEGDATRLTQVLTNLLSNAIKFTDRGGVTLRVRALAGPPGRLRIRFAVHDTGIGIAPEAQARLFMPFIQADASTTRRFGGTGLGLSIVRRLTELMGGTVGFSSGVDRGSEFWVLLDFAPSRTDVRAPPASPGLAERGSLRGARVLVVDDSEINLDVARRILELEGAQVAVAGNGLEACEQLQAEPLAFDAVLMDVQMPVLDGYKATQRIRGELGLVDLPIIALTAGALTSERQRAAESGMDDFVTKPFDPRRLVRCIRHHLAPARAAAAPRARPGARTTAPWPAIAGIDADDVSVRLGGDVALFRTLLERLFDEFADLDSTATGAAALQTLRARMHKLKGNAGTLGAKVIARLADEAESACAAGATADVQRTVERLVAELSLTRRNAAAAFAAFEPAVDAREAPARGDLDLQALAELVGLLRQQSLSALERFRDLAPQLRGRLGHASYELVRDHIDNLRFDAAAQLLDEGEARRSPA